MQQKAKGNYSGILEYNIVCNSARFFRQPFGRQYCMFIMPASTVTCLIIWPAMMRFLAAESEFIPRIEKSTPFFLQFIPRNVNKIKVFVQSGRMKMNFVHRNFGRPYIEPHHSPTPRLQCGSAPRWTLCSYKSF